MRLLPRAIVLASCLWAGLASAGAAEVRPVRLGTRFGDVHRTQSTARLADGRFAAVWGQGKAAFLQYVDPQGKVAFGSPGRLVATSPSGGGEAVVVAHARDGVLVAVRRRAGLSSSRIVVQWIDGQGRARWGAGVYAAPVVAREEQREPFLLAGPDGGGFVCFTRGVESPRYRSFPFCQRFSPEGQRLWGTEGARISQSPLFSEEPLAIAAGDGGLIVFWRDWGEVANEDPIVFLRGQRLGPDGMRQWSDTGTILFQNHFPCADGCAINPPGLSAIPDGHGGAIFAFDDQVGSLPEGIDFNHVTAQRIDSAGEKLWGDGVSVFSTRPPKTLYYLYAHPDGGAIVSAVSFPFELVSGGLHLVLQRLSADGRTLWPTDGVSVVDQATSPDGVYEGGLFSSLADGVLRIVWERTGSSANRPEIRFSAFDADSGNRLGPSDGVPLVPPMRPVDTDLLRGFVFDPASDTSFVVWAGAKGATGLVYTPE